MKGRHLGAVLTSGVAAGAVGLVCLLGAVLHSTAAASPGAATVSQQDAQNPVRSSPTRTRDADKPRKDQPPPIRLWRGPTPEKHPPRPRKALA